jgi:hypothetical protein
MNFIQKIFSVLFEEKYPIRRLPGRPLGRKTGLGELTA